MSVKVNEPADNITKARAGWGGDMPEWVRLLAAACDRTNQRLVAERLGWSSGTISKVVNRVYRGSYAEAETRVRAAYGEEEVACPLHGPIPLASCVTNRRRTAHPINDFQAEFARACPTCPNNTDHQEI